MARVKVLGVESDWKDVREFICTVSSDNDLKHK